MTLWRWLLHVLAWLSADPQAVDLEHPKAAAAVSAARASMLVDTAPTPPGPTPAACDCGATCLRGTWKPDGKIPQACKCACQRCVAERAKACPDGRCPPR